MSATQVARPCDQVETAHRLALQKHRDSPFAMNARDEGAAGCPHASFPTVYHECRLLLVAMGYRVLSRLLFSLHAWVAPTAGRRHGAMFVRMTERHEAPGLVDLASRRSTVCATVCASHRIARRPHCRADRGAGRPDCAGAPAPLAAGNSLSTRTAGNSWFRFTRGTKRFNCAAPAPNARLTRGRASSIHGSVLRAVEFVAALLLLAFAKLVL